MASQTWKTSFGAQVKKIWSYSWSTTIWIKMCWIQFLNWTDRQTCQLRKLWMISIQHMACRPLFRLSGFLFIIIVLWPLTFFKHGYDGYHEAFLVNSCSFGNDIAENKASNFAFLSVEPQSSNYPYCMWERLLLFENQLPLLFRLTLPFNSFIYQWRGVFKPWSL